MRVLIIGNLGYIRSVLSNEMKDQYEITGYNIGYLKIVFCKNRTILSTKSIKIFTI